MMRSIVALIGLFLFAAPAVAQQVNTSILPISSASAENNHVVKTSGGRLYQITVANGTSTAGFVEILDSATNPGAGSVTPVLCFALPASGSFTLSMLPTPAYLFKNGITVLLSSASSCFQYTTGTITGFIQAMVQ